MREVQLELAGAGQFPLCLHQWSDPQQEEEPQAVIHLVHGMAEHSLRYRYLAKCLVEQGFIVVASDLRGHGKTAAQTRLGHFGDKDSWSLVVNDLAKINHFIKAQFGKLPLFMFGHSMGSFLTQTYMIDYGGGLAGVILSGSHYDSPLLMKIAWLVPFLESLRQGKQGRSALVNFLSFGSFNKAFKPVRTPYDWLSRDFAVVDQYCADQACGFRCTNQLWMDFLAGLARIFDPRQQQKIPKSLPVYIIGGQQDPVSKKGAGLRQLEQSLRQAGLSNVTCQIYQDARHEVINETNKDEVIANLISWLKQPQKKQLKTCKEEESNQGLQV